MSSPLETIGQGTAHRDAERDRTEHRAAPHLSDRMALLSLLAIWLIAIVLLTALDLDIGSQRYLRNDLLFRGAASIEEFHRQPTMDPSPHAVALPADRFVQRALHSGELPLWDRSQGGGFSPFVQGNLGVLFPVRWFAALFPAGQVQSVVLLTTWVACLALSYLAGRRLGFGVEAASLGAAVYGLSGFLVGQLLFDGVAVYLFLPWLLFAYLDWFERPTALRFVHLVVAFALSFSSGHMMLLASVFLGVGCAALLHAWFDPRSARPLAGLALASVWGALLAAPILLPFLHHFRGAWKYKTQTAQGVSYQVANLAGWFERLQAIAFDRAGPFLDGPGFYLYLGLPVLALALLGAVQCWRRQHRRLIPVQLCVMFIVCVPGPWMAWASEGSPLTYIRTLYLYALFVFAVAVAAAAGLDFLRSHPRLPRPGLVCWLVVFAVATGSLVRAGPFLRPVPVAALPQSDAYQMLRSDPDRYRVTGLWGQVHLPNLANVSGIEDLRLMAVVMNSRYHAWFELVDPEILDKGFPTVRITEQLGSPLIGGFNVKYVLAGKLPHHYLVTQLERGDPFGAFDPSATRIASENLAKVYEDGLLEIHRVTGSYRPRAYYAPAATTVEPGMERAAAWLSQHPERLADTVVVEVNEKELARKVRGTSVSAGQRVSVTYPTDARVELQSETDRPALLVLNDLFEAGWTARVDGVAAEILPVNLISRGIWLEPGKHRISMRYWPPGLSAGLAVCGFALLMLLAYAWRGRSGGKAAWV